MPLGLGNTDASDFEKSFLREAVRSAVRLGSGSAPRTVREAKPAVWASPARASMKRRCRHAGRNGWEARSQGRAFPLQMEDVSAHLHTNVSGQAVTSDREPGDTGSGNWNRDVFEKMEREGIQNTCQRKGTLAEFKQWNMVGTTFPEKNQALQRLHRAMKTAIPLSQ